MLPIVAGGTSYWIQHLIFPNRLVSLGTSRAGAVNAPESMTMGPEVDLSQLPLKLRDLFHGLPGNVNADSCSEDTAFDLHTLLSHLDPATGARWHWKDTRKVLRSLSVIQETGKKASDVMIEQDGIAGAARYDITPIPSHW